MKAEVLVLNEPTKATGRVYAMTPEGLMSIFKINLNGGVPCELNGPNGPIDQSDLLVINQEQVCGVISDLRLEAADGTKAEVIADACKLVGTFALSGPKAEMLEQYIKDQVPFYFSAHVVTHNKEGIRYIQRFVTASVQPQLPQE